MLHKETSEIVFTQIYEQKYLFYLLKTTLRINL